MAKYRRNVNYELRYQLMQPQKSFFLLKNAKVTENGIPISSGKLFEVEQLEEKVKIKTGSGKYHFEVKK